MNQRTVTAEEANVMIGRTWFEGEPATVLVHDAPVALPALDAAGRAPERAIYVHGLQVAETANFADAPQSVYVILGDLTAKRLEHGSATLAVSGRIVAEDYVFAPHGTGPLAVGGDVSSDEATSPALPPVLAPIVVWFDPRRNVDVVYAQMDRTLRKLAPDEFPPALRAAYDEASQRFVDVQAALDALRAR